MVFCFNQFKKVHLKILIHNKLKLKSVFKCNTKFSKLSLTCSYYLFTYTDEGKLMQDTNISKFKMGPDRVTHISPYFLLFLQFTFYNSLYPSHHNRLIFKRLNTIFYYINDFRWIRWHEWISISYYLNGNM